ncbi:MAG: efflux RND transporter periplasmic adaptor subunit [Porticoccaceae bacterium]
MNRRNRINLALTAIILVILLAAWGYRALRGSSAPELSRAPVERADLEETITAQGKLEPKEYVIVGAQVSGQLSKLHVAIGDRVETGQLIAEIDPRILEARVAADRARLAALEAQRTEQRAQITYAAQVLARNRELIGLRAVSQEALEESESALAAAQARATSLAAQIDEARSTLFGDETNLGYTRILAPMSGTVVSQTAREGQTLNANQLAPEILQIADLGTMTVRAQVAEADIPRIRPGMPVYFTILGALERRWRAEVRQILPSPELINDVVLYNVLADVDNRGGELMNGMTTQMFFIVARAEQVPSIPTVALGRRLPVQDDAGEAYEIERCRAAGCAPATVQIGIMTRARSEVRAGLEPGDQVLLPVAGGASAAGRPRRLLF